MAVNSEGFLRRRSENNATNMVLQKMALKEKVNKRTLALRIRKKQLQFL